VAAAAGEKAEGWRCERKASGKNIRELGRLTKAHERAATDRG